MDRQETKDRVTLFVDLLVCITLCFYAAHYACPLQTSQSSRCGLRMSSCHTACSAYLYVLVLSMPALCADRVHGLAGTTLLFLCSLRIAQMHKARLGVKKCLWGALRLIVAVIGALFIGALANYMMVTAIICVLLCSLLCPSLLLSPL